MSAAWRTVRVFISSTFRDMQAERDHLVRFVFPRLREVMARRRIHLIDIDLRWGVTADQNALELCLDEIDRCRPRFLCMLGGRYGWVPSGSESSITAAEIDYGALAPRERTGFRSFYFRNPAATASVPDDDAGDYREPEGSSAAAALDALKERIRSATGWVLTAPETEEERPLRVIDYSCTWDTRARRFVGLETFGNAVYTDLLVSVEAELGPDTDQPTDEFAEERAAMDAFAESRVDRFVTGSRQTVIDRLSLHANGRQGAGWLVVTGPGGSGKSALLGKFWHDRAGNGQRSGADEVVVAHFAGASAASTSVRQILRRFCQELARALGGNELLPDDVERLQDMFRDQLALLAQTRSVVIIIDGLNQIESAGDGTLLAWLPETLPTGARIICSLLPGPALEVLRARPVPPDEVALAPLDRADATAIVDGYLDLYRKSLDIGQRATLLAKSDAGRPLYLLTALEELRTLGTHEEISDRIAELPGETVPLFEWILRRLERDPGFHDAAQQHVGPVVVRSYCSILVSGRFGMAESELAELVAPGDAGTPADSLGNVAALQRLLRPYLMYRGPFVDVFHGQLREAIEAMYLAERNARLAIHGAISDYFRDKGDPAGDRTWTANHVRALSELPYHQTKAEMWDAVYETLTDLAFLEAKCTHVAAVTIGSGLDVRTTYTGVFELQEDYRRALEAMPSAD